MNANNEDGKGETVKKVKNSENVYMSNKSVNAIQPLSSSQLKLMRAAFYLARQTGDDDTGFVETKPIVIRVDEFVKRLKIKGAKGSVYQQLKEAALGFMGLAFKYQEITDGKRKTVVTNWTRQVTYVDGSGEITMLFDVLLKDHISSLGADNPYTNTRLSSYAGLNSSAAIRLYELLARFKSAGSCKYTIAELRALLLLEGATEDRVVVHRSIKPALIKINKSTELTVKMEPVKKGRKIEQLKFSIAEKVVEDGKKPLPNASEMTFEEKVRKRVLDLTSDKARWPNGPIDITKSSELRSLQGWLDWANSQPG